MGIIHRPYNTITIYDDVLIKTSPLKQGVGELYWYQNIPAHFHRLLPKIHGASFLGDTEFCIRMEYLEDYENLGSLIASDQLQETSLSDVIQVLLDLRNHTWENGE